MAVGMRLSAGWCFFDDVLFGVDGGGRERLHSLTLLQKVTVLPRAKRECSPNGGNTMRLVGNTGTWQKEVFVFLFCKEDFFFRKFLFSPLQKEELVLGGCTRSVLVRVRDSRNERGGRPHVPFAPIFNGPVTQKPGPGDTNAKGQCCDSYE